MKVWQQTIARSTDALKGEALDLTRRATVRFHPGAPDAGFVFVRADLPGSPEIACRPENAMSMPRWTSLVQEDVVVHHTEHVLAAAAGLGIDNLRMELTGDRVPVMVGGSAQAFVETLANAGVVRQRAPREVFRLRQALFLEASLDGGTAIRGTTDLRTRAIACLPSDRFTAQYVFQAMQGEKEFVATAEWDGGPLSFVGPLSSARSYYLASEEKQLRVILNPLLRRLIRLGPTTPQKRITEVARHKLVDFIGDLAILGRRIQGRFIAVRSGHALHHDLVRALAAGGQLERFRLG